VIAIVAETSMRLMRSEKSFLDAGAAEVAVGVLISTIFADLRA
jgi:hypothetical protein